MAEDTRTYHAMSALNSRTMWVGAFTVIAGILSLPEVMSLIPVRYLPAVLSVVGFVVMYLRTTTVRPIAFISSGDTKAVQVAKIDPPAKTMTD